MPNQKKRQRRTGREDEEQAMSKRLRSSAEAVEVVQLALLFCKMYPLKRKPPLLNATLVVEIEIVGASDQVLD